MVLSTSASHPLLLRHHVYLHRCHCSGTKTHAAPAHDAPAHAPENPRHRCHCSSNTTYLCTIGATVPASYPGTFAQLPPALAVLLQLCARPAGAIRPCRKTCTYASRHNTPLPRYAPVFSSRISVASRRQKHKMRRRLRRRRRRRRLRSLREHTTRCLTFGPHGTGTQSGLGWAAAGAA